MAGSKVVVLPVADKVKEVNEFCENNLPLDYRVCFSFLVPIFLYQGAVNNTTAISVTNY